VPWRISLLKSNQSLVLTVSNKTYSYKIYSEDKMKFYSQEEMSSFLKLRI
jgi:hypothetical protein